MQNENNFFLLFCTSLFFFVKIMGVIYLGDTIRQTYPIVPKHTQALYWSHGCDHSDHYHLLDIYRVFLL